MRQLARHLATSLTPRWRRRFLRVLTLACLLAGATEAAAQPPPPPPAESVVTVTRSWYLDAAIVTAVMGLALFVVCRSSRRN